MLDDQLKINAETGEASRAPWSAEDLARFTRLVQDAVGFDASRGDSVSVINTSFTTDLADIVELPWYQNELFLMAMGGLKQLVPALLIFILVWFVLRPVMKNIANPNKAGAGSGGDVDLGDMGGLDGELSADRVSLGGPQSILLPSPSEGYDAQLNAIKSLVAEDPGRVAQVVKEWINADE